MEGRDDEVKVMVPPMLFGKRQHDQSKQGSEKEVQQDDKWKIFHGMLAVLGLPLNDQDSKD